MQRLALLAGTVLLAGCSLFAPPAGDSSGSSSSQAALPETRNVSYTGTVEDAGIGIAMEGTHRLRLADGKSVLLQSGLLELDDYVGLEIVATGAVRPTVEAGGGIIMRVESVTVLTVVNTSSSAESSSAESLEASSFSSSVSSALSSAAPTVQSSKPSAASVVSAPVSKASVAPATPSSAAAGLSGEVELRVKAMAKEDIAANRWTQQYCTSHIGFCVPIHKNWWFTSFGTAGSALWHVEVSSEEIEGLGDGPIVVNLMTGGVESAGASDGAVVEKNGYVVAYRAWEDNTHFEVSAPLSLRAAVTYMARSITTYAVAP